MSEDWKSRRGTKLARVGGGKAYGSLRVFRFGDGGLPWVGGAGAHTTTSSGTTCSPYGLWALVGTHSGP